MDIQQVMAEVHRPHCSDCDYDIRCEGRNAGCDCECHPRPAVGALSHSGRTSKKMIPVEQAELPSAIYPCADDRCAEEVSYPPELLAYYDGRPIEVEGEGYFVDEELLPTAGWYCTETCWSDGDVLWHLYPEHLGPSLESELDRRSKLNSK